MSELVSLSYECANQQSECLLKTKQKQKDYKTQNQSPKMVSSSSSSQEFLEWPRQQRHHEDHYSQSKYEQYQTVL